MEWTIALVVELMSEIAAVPGWRNRSCQFRGDSDTRYGGWETVARDRNDSWRSRFLARSGCACTPACTPIPPGTDATERLSAIGGAILDRGGALGAAGRPGLSRRA